MARGFAAFFMKLLSAPISGTCPMIGSRTSSVPCSPTGCASCGTSSRPTRTRPPSTSARTAASRTYVLQTSRKSTAASGVMIVRLRREVDPQNVDGRRPRLRPSCRKAGLPAIPIAVSEESAPCLYTSFIYCNISNENKWPGARSAKLGHSAGLLGYRSSLVGLCANCCWGTRRAFSRPPAYYERATEQRCRARTKSGTHSHAGLPCARL